MSDNQAKQKDKSAPGEKSGEKSGEKPSKERKGLGKEIKIGMGVIGVLAIVLVVLVVRRLSGPHSPPTAAIPPADDPRAEALLADAVQPPTILPATSAIDVPQPYAIETSQSTEPWRTSSAIHDADAAPSRHLMPQHPASENTGTRFNQAPGSSRDDGYELPSRYSAPINDGLNTIPTPSYRDSTGIDAAPADPLTEDALSEASPTGDSLSVDALPAESLAEAASPALPAEQDFAAEPTMAATNPAPLDSVAAELLPYDQSAESSLATEVPTKTALIPNANLQFTSPIAVAAESAIPESQPTIQQPVQTVEQPNPPAEQPVQITESPIRITEPPVQIAEPAAPAASPQPEPNTYVEASELPPAALPTTTQPPTAQQAAQPLPPAQRQAVPGVYVIEQGDNFWTISEKLYGTDAYFKALFEHNRDAVADPNRLLAGNQIVAPPQTELARLYPELCPPQPSTGANPQQNSQFATAQRPVETYVSEAGDTLYDIARRQLGDGNLWPHIYHLNRETLGADLDYLAPGTELVVPASRRSEIARQPTGTTQR